MDDLWDRDDAVDDAADDAARSDLVALSDLATEPVPDAPPDPDATLELIEAYREQLGLAEGDPTKRHLVVTFTQQIALLEEQHRQETVELTIHESAEVRRQEAIRLAGDLDHPGLRERLHAVGELGRLLPAVERDLVREARKGPGPFKWSLIAHLLGRRRQSVHERYASDPEMPDPEDGLDPNWRVEAERRSG